MVHDIVQRYSGKQFRTIKQYANQLAGRKPARGHHDYRIPREWQDRRQKNPFKDIASSDAPTLARWIRADGHHADHARSYKSGSLSNAFRETIGTMHKVLRRDFHEHLQEHHKDLHSQLKEKHVGGGLGSLLRDGWNTVTSSVKSAADKFGSDVSTGLKRTHDVLDATAKSVGAQTDVFADKFLHDIGLRNQRKYQDAEVTDGMRLHARIAKSAYGSVDSREDVGDWKYLQGDSTDDYAVYHNKNTGKAVFHFRGTRPKEALLGQNADLLEDAKIAAGTTATMSGIDDARSRIRGLLDRYGNHNVDLSGYSLGGGRMLEAMNDKQLFSRLGDESYAIAPGITTLNPDLQKYASNSKTNFAYAANDGVSNALLGQKNDRHHIFFNYKDPVSAHTTFLNDLAA